MFPWKMFPFNNDNQASGNGQVNPQDIEKYIKNILSQVMPTDTSGVFNHEEMFQRASKMFQQHKDTAEQDNKKSQTSHAAEQPVQPDVYETFDDIYVRLHIKDASLIPNLKIYHTSNQCIIENKEDSKQKMTITLPSLVKKKGTSAQYKDSILEIRLSKNFDTQYTEIDVNEKL